MGKIVTIGIVATCIALSACVTSRSYTICNDLDANTVCPDNTANVIVGM